MCQRTRIDTTTPQTSPTTANNNDCNSSSNSTGISDNKQTSVLSNRNDQDWRSRRTSKNLLSKQKVLGLYWKEAISKKESLWNISQWSKLSLTLDGRDKLTKTLQYICRLLSWWYSNTKPRRGSRHYYYHHYNNNNNGPTAATAVNSSSSSSSSILTSSETPGDSNDNDIATRFRNLYKSLSMSRRAFTLGRFIIEFEKLWNIILHQQQQRWCYQILKKKNSNHTKQHKLQTFVLRGISSLSGYVGSSNYYYFDQQPNQNIKNKSPLTSSLATTITSTDQPTPLWKTICSLLKLIGLTGFFLGDNLTFLSQSKFLSKKLIEERWQTQVFAVRSYFFYAIIGWYVNYKEFMLHRYKLQYAIETLQHTFEGEDKSDGTTTTSGSIIEKQHSNNPTSQQQQDHHRVIFNKSNWSLKEKEDAIARLHDEKAKNFVLFLALVKSTADVLVFSNIPGIDLHQKCKGHKMNEGLHSLCGLLSACIVLFIQYPNLPSK